MVQVETTTVHGMGFGVNEPTKQVMVKCGKCYHKMKIISYQIRVCTECGEFLPNVIRMGLYTESRISFHFDYIIRD